MKTAMGFAALEAGAALVPYQFERRDLRPHDVALDIHFCGVCHSDIHQVNNEWGDSLFPMVPGHEIVGQVTRVGSAVTRHRIGDMVGVGCMIDSCRSCPSCREGLEQFCEGGFVATYNAIERDGYTRTHGGYADHIVTDEAFVLRIPPSLGPAGAAPLLCAGITTYSPLRHWRIAPGALVGVVGLGGLGHMAVKLAHAMGAEVVLFTTSAAKAGDAARLGAGHVVMSKDRGAIERWAGRFDLILDTVAAPHDINSYTTALKRDGTLVLLGLPDRHFALNGANLIFRRARIAGSLIGGIKETQEMLDFCANHGIVSDTEVIPIQNINEAYRRMLANDVKYRFVIDMGSLRG